MRHKLGFNRISKRINASVCLPSVVQLRVIFQFAKKKFLQPMVSTRLSVVTVLINGNSVIGPKPQIVGNVPSHSTSSPRFSTNGPSHPVWVAVYIPHHTFQFTCAITASSACRFSAADIISQDRLNLTPRSPVRPRHRRNHP